MKDGDSLSWANIISRLVIEHPNDTYLALANNVMEVSKSDKGSPGFVKIELDDDSCDLLLNGYGYPMLLLGQMDTVKQIFKEETVVTEVQCENKSK